ncbi:TetR/AcrR family transcriptional regulator [Streptomyces sp. JL4002]|uniref:TetR/AcrR family transcriptional regulator n=1 Tax=Streptomyces sp. JL4002 TaxID=3404781 RepID=UPI003B28548B
MSAATREKLLEGALRTLVEQGVAKTSARTIAATAGVGQGLIFYHFGSVDELLAAACRYGAEQRVARHRDRLAAVGSLGALLEFAREMHAEERAAGYVAMLGQLLAAGQSSPTLAAATADGIGLWIAELEAVLTRLLEATPLAGFADPAGLARATAASFVGIELYEGVDPAGAGHALDALEQLAGLASVLEGLGPLGQRAVRRGLRRGTRG